MKIIENSILKEKLYTKTYKSGLRAYVMPKSGYDKSFAIFATHFGSINDKFIEPNTKEEVVVLGRMVYPTHRQSYVCLGPPTLHSITAY